MSAPDELLRMLPDLPRWVEARSLILSGRGHFLRDPVDPGSGVVVQPNVRLAAVIGCPEHDLVREAAVEADQVLAVPESVDWVRSGLPGWTAEEATLHELVRPGDLPTVPAGSVRVLDPGEAAMLSHLPSELREELILAQLEGAAIAAALHDDRPVAFCYAGSITERWWDIGIDTIEPYRRRGYAARCAAYLIRRFELAGKAPVWGAVASNVASVRLAAKLGFVPLDSIWVVTRPAAPATVLQPLAAPARAP